MPINVNQLVTNIKVAATEVLGRDVATLRGFSEEQVRAIAQHAAFIARGIESGEITAETRDYFLDSLEDMALNFVRTLRGLVQITIERVWNAVVQAIWRFVRDLPGVPDFD